MTSQVLFSLIEDQALAMGNESHALIPGQPAAGKSCGSCTLCCKVLGITALQKPHGTWCKHCTPGKGCGIYPERPEECRRFSCMWLLEPELGPEWKPDRSKIVLNLAPTGNGIVIRCDPGYPQAWRREPYYQKIHQWAFAARPHDGTVIVLVGKEMTIIAPEGEFPLGEVDEKRDRIATEFAGSRLVGFRVVRMDESNQASDRPEIDHPELRETQ